MNQGPWVSSFAICHEVIEEDGHKTIRKLFDAIGLVGARPFPRGTMPEHSFNIPLLVRLFAGSRRGEVPIAIRISMPPYGHPGPTVTTRTQPFTGDDNCFEWQIEMTAVVSITGTYWFGLYIDGQEITRIPLKITYMVRDEP